MQFVCCTEDVNVKTNAVFVVSGQQDNRHEFKLRTFVGTEVGVSPSGEEECGKCGRKVRSVIIIQSSDISHRKLTEIGKN